MIELFRTPLIALFIATLASVPASAQELPLRAEQKNTIERSISIHITPSGEKYIEKNFKGLLDNFGLSIGEGYFPELKFESSESIPLENISSDPEVARLVNTTRTLLEEWFMGLQISDLRPSASLKNAGYRVSFSQLTLTVDRERTRRLQRTSGVVLVLAAEIDRISLGADELLVEDLNNTFLGKIGFVSPLIASPTGSPKLKLKIPFFFDVHPENGLKVHSFPISSNFQETSMGLGYGELLTPDVTIEMNGRRFPLNKKHLVQTFEDYRPQLTKQVLAMLDSLAEKQLPELINTKIKETLAGSVEQVSKMPPPAIPENSDDPEFIWGSIIRKVQLNDTLNIEIDSYIEDPLNPGFPLFDKSISFEAPDISGMPSDKYDIGLTINRGLINRLLQLSYIRGYLKKIETDENQTLKFYRAPILDGYAPTANQITDEPKLKVRVFVKHPATGLQRLVISGSAYVAVNVIARLTQEEGEKGMRAILDSIDVGSLYLADDSLTVIGRLFKGMIVKTIKEELKKVSDGWKKKETALPGDLPLPPEIFGLKLDMKKMKIDKNGYLVMYLNFGDEK